MLFLSLEKLRLEKMAVQPARPKGPPLNALRAFEAAGRLESFALAGEELSVTPGAISQHIKSVEGWVGTPLFKRQAQGVILTETGQNLLPHFTQAFDQLGEATRALRSTSLQTEIHIATMPSLAQLWLPKRLAKIRATFPEIKLSVTALETPPNLNRELFDLSIFLREPTGAATEHIIAQDVIYPVCAPTIANSLTELRQLRDHPLLTDKTWASDWETWVTGCNLTLPRPKDGATYSLYSLALEEAKAGAGILIGHECLVETSLRDGTLARPFGGQASTALALVLERPQARENDDTLERISGMIKSNS